MKKFFSGLFLLFSLLFTNIRSEDIVSNYLKEIGLHGIITKGLLVYNLYNNVLLAKNRISPRKANLYNTQQKPNIPIVSKSNIVEILKNRGIDPSRCILFDMTNENLTNEIGQCYNCNDWVAPGIFSSGSIDEKPILYFNNDTNMAMIYHEAKHLVQLTSRSDFWLKYTLPHLSFLAASIFAATHKKESITLKDSLLFYSAPFIIKNLFDLMIRKHREQAADDFIPNNILLLTEALESLNEQLNNKNKKYLDTASFGTFLCKELLPDSIGFSVWEAFIGYPHHPSSVHRINRLKKRIAAIQIRNIKEDDLTTPCPAQKPPFISDTLFQAIETTGMAYGLAAQGLYTVFGAEKTLDLMAAPTELLVKAYVSKACDMIQKKVSNKATSFIFNKR